MLTLGVLISGRGSNMRALIEAAAQKDYPAKVACVISNQPGAGGLDVARDAGISTAVINHRDFVSREEFEKTLDRKLNEYEVQLVCLAGFMRLLTPWFVRQWHDRLINIHPSLLPAYPGLNTHQSALDAGDKCAGCTVHFVRPELDGGPIILQASVPILTGDTEETLAARVLLEEHKIYPAAVRLIAEKRINVCEEKVFIADQ